LTCSTFSLTVSVVHGVQKSEVGLAKSAVVESKNAHTATAGLIWCISLKSQKEICTLPKAFLASLKYIILLCMKKISKEWLYPNSIQEAIKVQKEMAGLVIVKDCISSVACFGGMDTSNRLFDPNKKIYASCVVLSKSNLKVIESRSVEETQEFAYIPGLLGFREAPSLIHAYEALQQKPDLIMIDGHGICHPRGLGIASHIGVLLDCPTIGVAKSILIGEPEGDLGYKAGSKTRLLWKGNVVGSLLRSKDGCRPLIISPGYKISLETSIELVLEALRGYRLPEPTKQAHIAANRARKR
jgi:deoxyribonuclease V